MLLLQARESEKLKRFHFRQKQRYIDGVPLIWRPARAQFAVRMTVGPDDVFLLVSLASQRRRDIGNKCDGGFLLKKQF